MKLPHPSEANEVIDVARSFEEDIIGRSEEPAISDVNGIESVLCAKPLRDLRREALVKQELVGHEGAPCEGTPW